MLSTKGKLTEAFGREAPRACLGDGVSGSMSSFQRGPSPSCCTVLTSPGSSAQRSKGCNGRGGFGGRVPEERRLCQSHLGPSRNAGCPRGAPAANSLAAVGVEDSTEEFHAHDGEGVVEDEQGEAQAGEEGQSVIEGPAGEPSLPGGPGTADPRADRGETCAPSQVRQLESACRGRASDSGQGVEERPG